LSFDIRAAEESRGLLHFDDVTNARILGDRVKKAMEHPNMIEDLLEFDQIVGTKDADDKEFLGLVGVEDLVNVGWNDDRECKGLRASVRKRERKVTVQEEEEDLVDMLGFADTGVGDREVVWL
jgi:hypothetical protein